MKAEMCKLTRSRKQCPIFRGEKKFSSQILIKERNFNGFSLRREDGMLFSNDKEINLIQQAMTKGGMGFFPLTAFRRPVKSNFAVKMFRSILSVYTASRSANGRKVGFLAYTVALRRSLSKNLFLA